MTSELPDLLREQDGRHPLWLRVVFLVAALVCFVAGVVGWLIPVMTGIPFYAAGWRSWAWPATGRAASSTAWSGGCRRIPAGRSGA